MTIFILISINLGRYVQFNGAYIKVVSRLRKANRTNGTFGFSQNLGQCEKTNSAVFCQSSTTIEEIRN